MQFKHALAIVSWTTAAMLMLFQTSTMQQCAYFRTGDQVFKDNICFPHFISFPAKQIDIRKLSNVELIKTPSWSSPDDCFRDVQRVRMLQSQEAVVKRFFDVTIYRHGETTYFHGPLINSYSQRCDMPTGYITYPFNSMLSQTVHINHAILDASQWSNGDLDNWMNDKAFMFGILRELIEKRIPIIVDAPVPQKFFEFCSLLGISHDQIIQQTRFVNYKVGTVYVPYMAHCGITSAANMLLTQHWIYSKHAILYKFRKSPSDIVVVQHNSLDLCSNCIYNKDEIVSALISAFPENRVRVIIFDEIDMYGIMRVLSRSAVLVSPSMKGLTNMIFLPKGAGVVELFNDPVRCSSNSRELTNAMEFNYEAVMPLNRGVVNFTDIDTQKVVNAVERLLLKVKLEY